MLNMFHLTSTSQYKYVPKYLLFLLLLSDVVTTNAKQFYSQREQDL